MTSNGAVLEVKDLEVTVEGTQIIKGLSLTVPATPWGYLRVSSGGMLFIQR